ncbi:uncharacterized protein FYN12_011058 [Phoenicopterus ruber ruber]
MDFVSYAIGATIGIGLAMAVVKRILCALGFTKAGTAAGSVAKKLTSLGSTANSGSTAARTLMGLLGASGLPTAVKAALSVVGAVGAVIVSSCCDPSDSHRDTH